MNLSPKHLLEICVKFLEPVVVNAGAQLEAKSYLAVSGTLLKEVSVSCMTQSHTLSASGMTTE